MEEETPKRLLTFSQATPDQLLKDFEQRLNKIVVDLNQLNYARHEQFLKQESSTDGLSSEDMIMANLNISIEGEIQRAALEIHKIQELDGMLGTLMAIQKQGAQSIAEQEKTRQALEDMHANLREIKEDFYKIRMKLV